MYVYGDWDGMNLTLYIHFFSHFQLHIFAGCLVLHQQYFQRFICSDSSVQHPTAQDKRRKEKKLATSKHSNTVVDKTVENAGHKGLCQCRSSLQSVQACRNLMVYRVGFCGSACIDLYDLSV